MKVPFLSRETLNPQVCDIVRRTLENAFLMLLTVLCKKVYLACRAAQNDKNTAAVFTKFRTRFPTKLNSNGLKEAG